MLVAPQEKKIQAEVASLERDTGFKLRVLAQNYPETPGGLGWGGFEGFRGPRDKGRGSSPTLCVCQHEGSCWVSHPA